MADITDQVNTFDVMGEYSEEVKNNWMALFLAIKKNLSPDKAFWALEKGYTRIGFEEYREMYALRKLGYSINQIAKMYSLEPAAIRAAICKYKSKFKYRLLSKPKQVNKGYKKLYGKDELIELYVNQGLSQTKIAEMFNTAQCKVSNDIRRFGISKDICDERKRSGGSANRQVQRTRRNMPKVS